MGAADSDSEHQVEVALPFDKGQDLQGKIGFVCTKFLPALTVDGKDIRARVTIS